MSLKYNKEQLREAVSAVRRGQLTISKAAREYNVPRTTVFDHVKSPELRSQKGPAKQLTRQETDGLVSFLMYTAQQGFPMTRKMVRAYISEILRRSGRTTLINIDHGPSDAWFRNLVKEYPQLAFRSPACQDQARLRMANKRVIDEFFQLWETTLISNGVQDRPAQIFNCDETGWSGKDAQRTKVLGPKDGPIKQQRIMTSEHITAHLCVSADGHMLPTMIIFKGGLPHKTFKDGIPGSWLFATSESGYMDTELFFDWFVKCFEPNCGKVRPVVLLLDNHDSHISLKVVEYAREHGVIMVCMPSHTTHILQPLDVKIIGPLKAKMQAMATHAGFIRQGLTIGKAHMPALLAHAIEQTAPFSLKEAFRLSGIMPINPHAIDQSQLVPPSFPAPDDAGEQVQTCETCGQYVGQNPLVKRGLVPESLANILVPPPVKPASTKSKRVVPKGRVISGDEMLALLKEKEAFNKHKEEELEKRKMEREEKRKKKAFELEERQKKRKRVEEEKQSKNEKRKRKDVEAEVIASFYVCGVCAVHGTVDDDVRGVMWYGCDEEMCGRWFHELCLSQTEREFVRESLQDGSNWYCQVCKPWLYQEE